MDHRELLIKYIAQVINMEGVSFIPDSQSEAFTEQEVNELIKLEKESEKYQQ